MKTPEQIIDELGKNTTGQQVYLLSSDIAAIQADAQRPS